MNLLIKLGFLIIIRLSFMGDLGRSADMVSKIIVALFSRKHNLHTAMVQKFFSGFLQSWQYIFRSTCSSSLRTFVWISVDSAPLVARSDNVAMISLVSCLIPFSRKVASGPCVVKNPHELKPGTQRPDSDEKNYV